MKHKIVILDGGTVNPGDLSWEALQVLGEVSMYESTPEDKIIERIGDADIVFTNKTPISAEVIQKTAIRYIGLFSTGYNIIDIHAAVSKGIVVSNVPDYSSNVVAQFTFALLLNLCHKIQMHSDLVFQGEWTKQEEFCFWRYPQMELQGKTIGLIGYGSIAKKVAAIATVFDMNVLVYTRTPRNDSEHIAFVSFESLLQQSDIVSIHCPLFPHTEGLINKETLSLMKPTAFLINTARGKIIDEHAVCDALNDIRADYGIAGYAADVVSEEPMREDNPLLHANHCVISPHIAWVAKETRGRLLDIAIQNLQGFLSDMPQNVIKQ